MEFPMEGNERHPCRRALLPDACIKPAVKREDQKRQGGRRPGQLGLKALKAVIRRHLGQGIDPGAQDGVLGFVGLKIEEGLFPMDQDRPFQGYLRRQLVQPAEKKVEPVVVDHPVVHQQE